MIIYSKKIIRFIDEVKHLIKQVLAKEIGLKVHGERFYDQSNRFSYPIKIVIYNNKKMLGYFDSNFYELGFHERLMHSNRKQLLNLIRHELAHYLNFTESGSNIPAHGYAFKYFCQRMGWDAEVSGATFCLEDGEEVSEPEITGVLRKVQKLMALSTSSNQHEAEQAMIKSQQLLLKHNLESTFIESEDCDRIVLKRILKKKKENAKMRAIAKILETFFVSIVYNRAGEHTYLEILGSTVNVEIAEYVASVLEIELERLWNVAHNNFGLKGVIAKNSFLMGISLGYCNKIQAFKKEYDQGIKNALMVIEKQLMDAKAMVYQRLSSKKDSGNYCAESASLGEIMGRQLNINPAINKSVHSNALITF